MQTDDLVMIPMRDGIRIGASILWPDESREPRPVILQRALNRRRAIDASVIREMVEAGYVFVNSDIRGRFDSEGVWDPRDASQEGRDGYDTIEWIAAQPWCDGNVGTFGASHRAAYQVAAAMEHPPHLRAMALWTGGLGGREGTGGGTRPPNSGGVMSLITTLIWLPNEAADALDRLASEGEDVAEAKAVLARMRTHPEETFKHLPLREVPIARYGKLKELLEFRLSTAERPSGGSEDLGRYGALDVPIFHECGWYDPVAWNQFDAFAKMRKHGGSELARSAQFMTVGPWQHAVEHPDRLGDIWFGLTSSTAGSGTNLRQIAYFDRYLRGKDASLPAVRYFVMGVNEWRHADDWPLPGTTWQRFYLHSAGAANSSAGDGGLSLDEPAAEAPDSFIYDPETPVPTLGGNYVGVLNVPGMLVGPVDQYFVERRNDVLVYTTAPFEADTEVSGPLQLHLAASTSAVDTDFTAKLCHVYPDGRSYNLCEGIVRLRGRNLRSEWDEVTPGEIYDLTITIGQTSLVVQKGHALRLQVSSSNFPQFDRNMNTANPIGTDAHGVRALQTIYHDAEHQSYIDLPVAPAYVGGDHDPLGDPGRAMEG